MKKFLLLVFLIASVIVSAKTWPVANSLSPPPCSLDAISERAAASVMLQTLPVEIIQIDVGLFERDISYFVWFENRQSVISDTDVGFTDNFQVLVNLNNVSVFLGKSDALLAAISPNCRAVITSNFSQSVIIRNAVDLSEAISPKCRTVLSSCVISSCKCLIEAVSPHCRDVSFIA